MHGVIKVPVLPNSDCAMLEVLFVSDYSVAVASPVGAPCQTAGIQKRKMLRINYLNSSTTGVMPLRLKPSRNI